MSEDVSKNKKDFEAPRHWVDLDELTPAYWENEKSQEVRGQEFFKKPVETIALIDRLDKGGLERREFLTIMGASMALAGLGFARKPIHKIIPYAVQPIEIKPGEATWYATTYNDGVESYGVLVKNREGRPIKLEGNPDHPVNKGKLNARGQAALLDLYDPDRLRGPMSGARTGGEAGFKTLTWAEVSPEIQKAFKQAAGSGKVRVLSGYLNGVSQRQLVHEFLGAFSDGEHIEFAPGAAETILEGQWAAHGTAEIPVYRFDKAKVVLSLGSDFLQTGLSSVEHARQWAQRRKLNDAEHHRADLSKLYCFESTVTVTGANADERFALRPGDEVRVGLAIAREISTRYGGSLSGLGDALGPHTVERVAEQIGGLVTAEKLRAIARDLWEHRGESLVIAGGVHSGGNTALGLQVVAGVLNELLGNEGKTVGGTGLTRELGGRAYENLIKQMEAGQVSVLVTYRSNPAYWDPRFLKASRNVKTLIAVTDRLDETARVADFALPDHHFLENWGDAQTRPGVFSLQQPAIGPLHDSIAFEDMLIKWARQGDLAVKGLAGQIVSDSTAGWHEYLKARWKQAGSSLLGGLAFEMFWEKALETGVVGAGVGDLKARRFQTSALGLLPKGVTDAKGAVYLALYEQTGIRDGTTANNAWLQEVPDPITTATWDNYLNIAPSAAAKMGVTEHDVVRVTAGDFECELPAHIQPGMHGSVVSAAIGYGRTAAGKVGNKIGVNVYGFVRFDGGRTQFSGFEAKLTKTGRRYEVAMTQAHHRTMNRPIVNDITLAAYRKKPGEESHTKPHLRMENVPSIWPSFEYKGNRWGMTIDLTSCTGCGACVVACQSENNVPVVGRDRVRVGREMHWIRIDRYYSGSDEAPDLIFQPMLCQHCENASCETVCPVLATTHSDEGLNDMTYNRCVGTRYCQNNCPYKVRRFNFFDHWMAYDKPLDLAWNPDVTVRTRGVMEKCTFCVQRIHKAKNEARKENRALREGDVVTACQQTCPTDAIVFGNTNDPKSQVSKFKAEARAFRVLEDLNNKPQISYLTKVRNKAAESNDEHVTEGGSDAHHS